MKLELHKHRWVAETLSEMYRNVPHRIDVKPLNHNWLRAILSFRGDGLLRPKYLRSKMSTIKGHEGLDVEYLGARFRWLVNTTPRPLKPSGNYPVAIVKHIRNEH
jgi:hypothetical protein